MTTLRGHFDGKVIVLDEPPPRGMAPNTPVLVTVPMAEAKVPATSDLLADLLSLSEPMPDLPHDFAGQHDHYVKDKPRR